jgi:hypothetical protein
VRNGQYGQLIPHRASGVITRVARLVSIDPAEVLSKDKSARFSLCARADNSLSLIVAKVQRHPCQETFKISRRCAKEMLNRMPRRPSGMTIHQDLAAVR